MYLACFLGVAVLLCPTARSAQEGSGAALSDGMRSAMADLQRGDFQAAEAKLKTEVETHPNDAWALSLLGSDLDNLKRIPEADVLHRRAIAKAPRSTEVLNNYAAHLWIAGNEQEAAKVYRQVVALEPSHYNANLQLARLALQSRNGPEALRCLDRLPAGQQESPQVLLPRLEALYLSGDSAAADALAERLSETARADGNLGFAVGITLSNAGQFAKAETFFESTLARDPVNFQVLYDLGIAATRAGHLDRAREVLEAALRQQPQNVDVLYALACTDHALRQWETAVRLLSQAAKLEPRRADVQKMLAIATSDLGALDDAAAAWDRYLKLAPNDDIARRERGYTAAQRLHFEDAIDDLAWYAGKHPEDVAGHYELGQAERTTDISKALQEFDRALAIDPNYVPARTARGSLYYQQGKPEAAVKDLEAAAALRPNDAANLDRLGQTYQALDRTADAVAALRRAADLAPGDSKILLHFAHALAASGDTAQSKAVMDRFRQLGPEKKSAVPAGFVDYLSLSDEERHADYRARVEKAVREHPDDAAAQSACLKLLLEDGNVEAATAAAHRLAALKPPPAVLVDAAGALLESRQYAPARELLALVRTSDPAVEADLAIANFQMLEAAGKNAEAAAALQDALKSAPERADLIRQAAAFQIRRQSLPEALSLTDRAARAHPADREILLVHAVTLSLAGQTDSAAEALTQIQNRWPEWPAVWLARGIALHDPAAIETAKTLGAHAGPDVDSSWLLQHPLRAW